MTDYDCEDWKIVTFTRKRRTLWSRWNQRAEDAAFWLDENLPGVGAAILILGTLAFFVLAVFT